MGTFWINNDQKVYFHTIHLTPNLFFSENNVLNSQNLSKLPRELRDELSDLLKTLQEFLQLVIS